MCVFVLSGELFYDHRARKQVFGLCVTVCQHQERFCFVCFVFFNFILGHDTDLAHLDMTRVQISTLRSSKSQTKNGIKW